MIATSLGNANSASALPWKLTSAYNFGFFNAHGLDSEYVLKVDCDTRLSPLFFKEGNDLRERSELDAEYGFINANSMKQSQIDNNRPEEDDGNGDDATDNVDGGVFIARSERVRRVNGFDERIQQQTSGIDENDLYARLTGGEREDPKSWNDNVDENKWGLIRKTLPDGGKSLIDHLPRPQPEVIPSGEVNAVKARNCHNTVAMAILRREHQPWRLQSRSEFFKVEEGNGEGGGGNADDGHAANIVDGVYSMAVWSAMAASESKASSVATVDGLTYEGTYVATKWAKDVKEALGPKRFAEVLRKCQESSQEKIEKSS